MGIAATVYIKRDHISIEWLDETLYVDERTGEVISQTYHIPAKAKEAISYRLGNGKYLQKCRLEIEAFAKGRGLAMPVLLGQVLSPDLQAGDVVTYTDIPALKRELKYLEQAVKPSDQVKEIHFRLGKLVAAAETNRNPIAFA